MHLPIVFPPSWIKVRLVGTAATGGGRRKDAQLITSSGLMIVRAGSNDDGYDQRRFQRPRSRRRSTRTADCARTSSCPWPMPPVMRRQRLEVQ